jgi:hypothetical protein
MTVPGVGQLTALAFVAAIDESVAHPPIQRSRRLSGPGSKALISPGLVDTSAAFRNAGPVEMRDRRVRTLLYESR